MRGFGLVEEGGEVRRARGPVPRLLGAALSQPAQDQLVDFLVVHAGRNCSCLPDGARLWAARHGAHTSRRGAVAATGSVG